ncbi:MAG: hypothetical protein NZV14_02815 [Bryobacteraceae bacterium]|nr:hypothetical protein [Bryobacteraceae bacterium]MDW8377065.1 hypothetical protein [Bryobacterales bacterium]
MAKTWWNTAAAAVLLVLLAAVCRGEKPVEPSEKRLTPEQILLTRIRVRAQENLQALPNYTCLETIERSVRKSSSRRFELVDLLRLEVAYVNRRELFAWPGSSQFDDRDITEMVGHSGAIGNGSFALHVSGLFLSSAPSFRHVGKVNHEGRVFIQFDYSVPRLTSNYRMRVRPAEAFVGYEGSFWVHPETLDLEKLTLHVNDIPPTLPILSSSQTLLYHRVRIGEQDFLLTKTADLSITDLGGNESRNRTTFSNCRQYAIESVIRFEDVPEDPKVLAQPPQRVVLPPDLEIGVQLENEIVAGVSAIGDPVRGWVVSDVKRKKQIYVPRGAVVKGRLVRMQRLRLNGSVFWQAGLRLERLEFGNRFVELEATLDPSLSAPLPAWRSAAREPFFILRESNSEDPRTGILFLRGEQAKVAAGTRLYWRTLPPSSIEESK